MSAFTTFRSPRLQHNDSSLAEALRTMTKIFVLVAAFGLLGLIAGCDPSRDRGGGVPYNGNGPVAVTPMSNACGQGTNYQPSSWQNSPQARYGAVPYAGQGYPGGAPGPQGYCGCPQGYQPMCDQTYAMICVPVQNLERPSIAWWRYSDNGWGFNGYAGYNQIPRNPYAHSRRDPRRSQFYIPNNPQWPTVEPICSTHVGRTCVIGTNSCGGGACYPMQDSPGYAQPGEIGVCGQ